MAEVFGPISPFVITLIVTLLTQWTKSNFALTERQVQFVALGYSAIFITTFELLTQIDSGAPFTGLLVFGAIVYALMGWFSAIGMYEVASKQLTKR